MKARATLASTVAVMVCTLIVATVAPRDVEAKQVVIKKASGKRLPDNAITIEEIRKDGDRAILKVRNRTPFMIIVYIGGVRIGWMRPYRVGLIRGLMGGHHRMYAHSRYGTTSWGPRFVWIPGRWNLLY